MKEVQEQKQNLINAKGGVKRKLKNYTWAPSPLLPKDLAGDIPVDTWEPI